MAEQKRPDPEMSDGSNPDGQLSAASVRTFVDTKTDEQNGDVQMSAASVRTFVDTKTDEQNGDGHECCFGMHRC